MTTGANVLIDTDTNLTFPNFVASEMAATGITGGGIIKRGTGTLSLNAENSFLYVLNVQEGTVQLLPGSSVNALAQLNGGNVTVAVEASFLGGIEGNSDSTLTLTAAGNAVCTVDLGVVRELASLIQGAGGTLQKEGAGELQLTRTASANTYDGGTTIAAGVLAAVRDEALGPQTAALTYGLSSGDLPVYKFLDSYSSGRTWTLLADQSTVDTNGFTADIAGGTSGGGGLVVTGGGVATVSSHLMHTGVTKVGDATLAIKPNASIARGVDVTSAGTLKGTGTIGGDVVNAGVTRPGLSIGTLPIVGNYTESGTLTIELDPTSTSVLAIGGNMTINPGSTLLVSPDLGVGVYAPSKTYTVVTIGGTRTGTYSTVTTTFPNRFSAQALYNSIDILLNVLPFSNTIKGGNEGAVAKCVDAYPVTTDSDFIKVDDALTMLSNDVSALRSAFNKLQPSQFGALALVQENNDILLRNAITHRLSEVYPLTCDEEWINGHKGSLWVEGMGKYVEQDHQQKNHGFHAETGGVAMGADGRIAKKTYLGAAFGYTGTYLDWTASAGEAHINSYYGSLYGTWYNRHVFVDAAFIGGFNQYEEDRKIHFPGIKRTATSDHDGYQLAGSLGTGLLFTPSKWQIQPFVRADYVYLHQNGFTENGAKSLDLKVHDMHSNYVRTDLGLKLERCFDFIHTKVIPDLKLSWIWENQLDDAHIKSSFKGQSCSFTVTGMHPTHNLFAPAIGVMVMNLGGGMTSSIHYEAEIGKNVWENRLYLHFGWNY
ncbi:MAG: autotransporter domain-containing protein [Candidatus Melainabacteria bacterium]|nr:autotransporter domain-containing protein [Candidatus Melainabacteria bacterium]